jgi:predicted Zn-dependent protease
MTGKTATELEQTAGVSYSRQEAMPGNCATVTAMTAAEPVTTVMATGRYVMIRKNSDTANYLSLAEVEVLSGGVDIAKGRPVTSSGSFDLAWHKAANMVDGNESQASGIYASSTKGNGWIQIDLGTSTVIDSMTLFGRTDAWASQNGHYTVYVSNTDMTGKTAAELEQTAGVSFARQEAMPGPSATITAMTHTGNQCSFGYAGSGSHVTEILGCDHSLLADYYRSSGNMAGAAAATQGFDNLREILAADTGASVLENSRWNQNVITWSLATQGSGFSGYMDSTEEEAVALAFSVWSRASGLQFKEVADSSQTDIRIGWGDFNTADTGVIGLTCLQTESGRMAADTVIRIEDPSQDALIKGADGELIYTGTDAGLSQVLLHEIGHALGLADNTDATSIENYYLGSANRQLNDNDRAAIHALYGNVSNDAAMTDVNRLIQAMATFNAGSGAAFSSFSPQNSVLITNNNLAPSPSISH